MTKEETDLVCFLIDVFVFGIISCGIIGIAMVAI
jgi:hypothetical protein